MISAVKNKVLKSIHNETTERCVDFFVRVDGTFGYEEFRRDYEDGGGWFSLNLYSSQVFVSIDKALEQAKEYVDWLE